MIYQTHVIPTKNASIVIITAPRGFLMCGYLDLEAAQRMGDAAAMVRGVKTADDALSAKVVGATKKARELGIAEGMSGKRALELMQ